MEKLRRDPKLTFLIYGFLLIAILGGIYQRVDQYFFNRSLWLDEAFTAVTIVERGYGGLLQSPLEYSTYISPPIFLLITKLFTEIFGEGELALRLFPLLCGIFSLVLFYPMARQFVTRTAATFALILFTLSNSLISYSTELKQYSSDVLVVIVLLYIVGSFQKTVITYKRLIVFLLAGFVAIGLSHPSVFILATTGVSLAVLNVFRKKWANVLKICVISIGWLLIFLYLYFTLYSSQTLFDKWLEIVWGDIWKAFMPFPFSAEGMVWLQNQFSAFIKDTANLNNLALCCFLFILGLIPRKDDDFMLSIISIFVIFLTLCTSYFHLYPFQGRLLLYLLPIFFMVIARGINRFSVTHPTPLKITTATLQIAVFIYLIFVPVKNSYIFNGEKIVKQESRSVFTKMSFSINKDDRIYFHYWAEPVFRYYSHILNIDFDSCSIVSPTEIGDFLTEVDFSRAMRKEETDLKTKCILGNSSWKVYTNELKNLDGLGRVWFFITHDPDSWHEENFKNVLNEFGTFVMEIDSPGSIAFLYDL